MLQVHNCGTAYEGLLTEDPHQPLFLESAG